MRSSTARTAVIAVMVWLRCWTAPAQEHGRPTDTPRVHFGSLGLTPTIALTNIGTDSNVFNDIDTPKSDFTATVTPGLAAWWRIGRARVQGTGTADAVYFREYANLRSFNASGSVTIEIPANRVVPFVGLSRVDTRQRQGYEIDDRIRRLSRTATAGVRIKLAGKTTLEIAAHENDIAFDKNAIFRGLDLQTHLNERAAGVVGSVRYQLTPLTAWVVRAERSRDRFEFSSYRDSDSFRLTPGLEFNTFALIGGSAYVGYRRFDIANSEVPDFTGLVASVDLGYTLLGRTRFSVRADRDVAYSYDAVQPYYVLSGAAGGITQHLTSAWDVAVNVNRHRLNYKAIGDIPAALAREEIASSYRAEMGYRVGARARWSLHVDYFQRQIPQTRELNYDGVRFGSSVAYGL